MTNPFLTTHTDGRTYGAVSVDCRLRALADFDIEQCRQALQVPNLQRTVLIALQGRIRKLEKT